MDAVPDVVVNNARSAGQDGWLTDLPPLIAELEHEWAITVGRAFPDATEAFVAEAIDADGTPVVLKMLIPRPFDPARREIDVLTLADGEAMVRLLRSDAERGALLLERLGPSLVEMDRPILERHDILCTLASRVWRPAAGCGLPTGADHGRRLIEVISDLWERLDHPCTEAAVDQAVSGAERRIAAHDDERAVLVHGDVHQWNALEAGGGFKLVDPDGLLAEPELDLGVIMREDPVELVAGDPTERARRLAARTGRDATAIWDWGVAERVWNGLLLTEIDLQPIGRQMLAAADAVAHLDRLD